MGIHVDSPLQRQWTILDLSGSIFRITATVLGAAFSSRRAANVRAPTRIVSMPNTNRPTISTHVLDTARGEPAAGVHVTLSRIDGGQPVTQETDADGRIARLAEPAAGGYRLSFYFGGFFYKKGPLAIIRGRYCFLEIKYTSRAHNIPDMFAP